MRRTRSKAIAYLLLAVIVACVWRLSQWGLSLIALEPPTESRYPPRVRQEPPPKLGVSWALSKFDGQYVADGEALNASATTAKDVVVFVVFRGPDGRFVASQDGRLSIDPLPPMESSPWCIRLVTDEVVAIGVVGFRTIGGELIAITNPPEATAEVAH